MRNLETITLQNKIFIDFVKNSFKTQCGACIPKLIHQYIVKHFTYIPDQYDEVIQAPYILLNSKIGDCDDFSLFAFCALKILGKYPKYIVFGKSPGKFSHIAVMIDGKILDGTNPSFNDWQSITKKYNYFLYP